MTHFKDNFDASTIINLILRGWKNIVFLYSPVMKNEILYSSFMQRHEVAEKNVMSLRTTMLVRRKNLYTRCEGRWKGYHATFKGYDFDAVTRVFVYVCLCVCMCVYVINMITICVL